ncbi:MAG: hypothetical protein AB7T19_05430, partial [Planctomycetota bacterium]
MLRLNLLDLWRPPQPSGDGDPNESPSIVVVLTEADGGARLAAAIASALHRCGIAVLRATAERSGAAIESCLLVPVRRVVVGSDVHEDGSRIDDFRRGFLCGFAELLSRLGVTKPRDLVLREFLSCCGGLVAGAAASPSASLLQRLGEREASQARIVGHSIDALVGASPGSGSFDKWLGNTTRDAVGHCILERANEFFASTKSLPADWPWQLCDVLFDAVDAFVHRFGFAEHRGMGGEIRSTLAEVFAECR